MLIKEIQHHFEIRKTEFPKFPYEIVDSNGIGYSLYESKAEAKAMRRFLVRTVSFLVKNTDMDFEKVMAKLGTWNWEVYNEKPSQESIERVVRVPEMETKTASMPGGQMIEVSVPKVA